MLRRLALLAILLAAPAARADAPPECECDLTPAACDASCTCDPECAVDWSLDECADPTAGCLPSSTVPDEPALEAAESAVAVEPEPVDWTPAAAAEIACPDGATNQDGHCAPDPAAISAHGEVTGGCATTTPGLLVAAAVLGLIVIARRRRALLACALVACTVGDASWDDAVDAGPSGDVRYSDVFVADLSDGAPSGTSPAQPAAQFLLAGQPLMSGAAQPVAQFALARPAGGQPIFRMSGTCGDRLTTALEDGTELLGWARQTQGDGTAALVELVAPDGCTFAYETDPDAIDARVAAGYTELGTLGYVWPPGRSDEQAAEPPDDATITALAQTGPTPCTLGRRPAIQLLYSTPGSPYADRFLLGCPGEVVMGDKSENGPANEMRTAAAHAAGGRTGFILDRSGDKLRALLSRPNGFERTVAYLKHKLAVGYDYIVLDEVTAAPDYADGQWLNRAIRAMLIRLPQRSFIPYISIDLTQESGGFGAMIDRKYLLRRFEHHARVMALEVYIHTDAVIGGAAPGTFRAAANRLQDAVATIADAGGMNLRAITTLGATHRTRYAQYRYLDDARHDLAAITREVNALRGASRRTRQQHGIGWYFVDPGDLAPTSGYTLDQLVRRMRTQALRFR